jgi:diguanylate cyclase (GGDEF)-like protein
MQASRKIKDDTPRLRALQLLQVLEEPVDARLEKFTQLARKLFDVPVAMVSLVPNDRMWYRMHLGIDVSVAKRNVAACGRAEHQADIFVVEDARKDLGVHYVPTETDQPRIRFYAEYPIREPSGLRIGALCLIDSAPRRFSVEDREALRSLGQLAEQQLESYLLATTDELTKVSNRRGFLQLAQKGLAIANRAGDGSVLMMFDLDGFKDINDMLGHNVGDQALAEFARWLTRTCRDADIVGRLGGDEFCAFLPNCDLDGAAALVERLVHHISEVNASCALPARIQFSVGIAVAEPGQNQSLDTLLARADRQMYANKRHCRYRLPAAG